MGSWIIWPGSRLGTSTARVTHDRRRRTLRIVAQLAQPIRRRPNDHLGREACARRITTRDEDDVAHAALDGCASCVDIERTLCAAHAIAG
jgi:hypothetical protein